MSVYYYKGAQILAPFTIRSNEPMFDVDTISLKKERASQGAQRWELEFGTVGVSDTMQDMLIASVTDQSAAQTMFMPQLTAVDEKSSISSNTIDIAASASVGATSVSLTASGKTGTLPKGSFIKFSNSNKMYMTTTDVNLDGNTSESVSIYPELRVALTTANTLRNGDLAVLSYYKSIDNQSGITFTDGVLSNSGTISLIEAL